jgi:ABC-type nitrate/sulfonate/bicarbonate transport system permease component
MDTTKITPYLLPLIPLSLFFILWEIFANTGIVTLSLFSKPSIIFIKIIESSSEIFFHILFTFYRLIISFLIALLIGTAMGMIMGYKKQVYQFCNPLITTLMTIPGIAMAPLFIVWFGFGDPTIIAIGIIVAFFPIVYNAATGTRSVDPQLIKAAKIMGAKKRDLFLHVYLPHSASYLIIGSKLGLARCWRTIIAVEFIAATSFGLGYMMWDAYEYLNVTVVYSGVIILAVTFFIIEKTIIRYIEKRTIELWGVVQTNE